MSSRFLKICAVAIMCGAFLAGCETVLPIKEMVDAKVAISMAQKYQADKYAPDELKAASDALLLTHDNIKNDKEKESIASALDAKTKAEAALAKALPLLAKDTIDGAKKVIAEAKGLYSDEFAPDETRDAENLIGEADVSYEAKSYIAAYEKADKARLSATAARDKALARIPALKSKLTELETERDTLKSQNAASYAGDEMKALDTNLIEAKNSLDGNLIRAAVESLASASEWINKIKFMGAGALAQEKIARADAALAKVKSSPFAKDFQADIDNAGGKIAEAKAALGNGKPDEAGMRADEALAIIDSVAIQIAKKEEEAKNAAKLAASTEVKPETKKGNETIAAKVEGATYYIVQWRKRNTDCLWRIADKLYKNARLWPIIFMANRSQIKNPDLIYPGQKFLIPPLPKKKKAWELDKPIPIPESKPDEKASSETTQPETPTEPAKPADTNADKKNDVTGTTETPSGETVAPTTDETPSEDTAPPSDGEAKPAENQPTDGATAPESHEKAPVTEPVITPEKTDNKENTAPHNDGAKPDESKTDEKKTSDSTKSSTEPEPPMTKGTSAQSSEDMTP
ncbi:MAG TPA: hypothetical protein VF857_04245 [Spirochaetota bacterium]